MTTRDLSDLAQSMIARCASEGQATIDIYDRPEAEALRAELRSLARSFKMRVRTIHQEDRLSVVRLDDAPWDPTEAEAAQDFARMLREAGQRNRQQGGRAHR